MLELLTCNAIRWIAASPCTSRYSPGHTSFPTRWTVSAASYVAYDRLLNHWRETLCDRLIEVEYESLVADQEGQTRELLERLGLDFEEACLNFDQNVSATSTASAVRCGRKFIRAPSIDGGVMRINCTAEALPGECRRCGRISPWLLFRRYWQCTMNNHLEQVSLTARKAVQAKGLGASSYLCEGNTELEEEQLRRIFLVGIGREGLKSTGASHQGVFQSD